MRNKASCHEDVWCSGITVKLILSLSNGWRQVVSFILIAVLFTPCSIGMCDIKQVLYIT